MRNDPLRVYRAEAGIKRSELAKAVTDLLSSAEKEHGDVKIEVRIEAHEHKYFFVQPSQEAAYALSLGGTEKRDYEEPRRAEADLPAESMERPDLAEWREQVSRFERLRHELWANEEYRNKYVALLRGEVVDVDVDKFALAVRVAHAFEGEVPLIAKVQLGERMLRVPSPRRRA